MIPMTVEYLKKASRRSTDDASDIRATVQDILNRIEAGGDEAAKRYATEFDRYDGNIVLVRDEIEAAAEQVPQKLKDDIRFAWDNVRRFAEAQKETIRDMQIEISPGLIAGQKAIPCQAAGCYAPGGRYSHIASALMTVTTAKVAGCGHIAACSPPRPGIGVAPAIVYTADLCGADTILALGGVQGIAAMAFGLFGLPKADILVGPGNQFVAEAKRILFGRVGIDMFAGPIRISSPGIWSARPSTATIRRSGSPRPTGRWRRLCWNWCRAVSKRCRISTARARPTPGATWPR